MINEDLLNFAIQGKTESVRDCIVERGADINFRDAHGNSALHLAAHNGHFNTVVWLISNNNINPNIQDNHANTPLHRAIRAHHYKLIKFLLEYGRVNPMARNLDGKNPFEIIVDEQNKRTLLINCIYQIDNPLCKWIALKIINEGYMTEKGISCGINHRDAAGNSALDLAVNYRDSDIVYALSRNCVFVHQSGTSPFWGRDRNDRNEFRPVLIDRSSNRSAFGGSEAKLIRIADMGSKEALGLMAKGASPFFPLLGQLDLRREKEERDRIDREQNEKSNNDGRDNNDYVRCVEGICRDSDGYFRI